MATQRFRIRSLIAREILDSRGNPTVEARVTLGNGMSAVAAVPSGASTGTHEAIELRDGGKRYGGKGVLKAVANVNGPIARALKGRDVRQQRAGDARMLALDGTKNKSKLGANAILAVSLAAARVAATASKLPLYRYLRKCYKLQATSYMMPLAMMNVINGGRHADNTISSQEFMIIPKAAKFSERVRMGAEVFHALKGVLKSYVQVTTVGDEGGFAPNIEGQFGYAPNFDEDEIGLVLVVRAIKKAGYVPGKQIAIGMDIAASEFYTEGKGYDFNFKQKSKGKHFFSYAKVLKMYEAWIKKFPIISIEDPFAEDAWDEWVGVTRGLGRTVQIVGDDLFVTNRERLQRGIAMGAANAILIKLNQIGTLTETMDCIQLAKRNTYKTIISHRSGETADTFIADLAVAVNSEYIKTGSLSRSERCEKYNRLMEIEREVK